MTELITPVPQGWRPLTDEEARTAEDITLRYQLLAVRETNAKSNLARIESDRKRIEAETEVWNRVLDDIATDRKELNDSRGAPFDEKLGIRGLKGALRKIDGAWYCAPTPSAEITVVTPPKPPGDGGASQV